MQVNKMRCYFLYNVPVTETLMENSHGLGVTTEMISKFREPFTVSVVEPPPFYTNHYLQEHTSYHIEDLNIPAHTTADPQQIKAFPFYQDLALTQPIHITWEFVLTLQTTGLITVCLEVDEPLDSAQVYRLSGLHLNPAYEVIDTTSIAGLWEHEPKKRPPYITPDQLATAIHEHFFRPLDMKVRRFRALKHEIQIPFTSVEIASDCQTQREFIEQNRFDLAELVFKPASWEVERPSALHIDRVLDNSRVWSIAQDTYVLTGYEGAVYVKLTNFDTGIVAENSGFYLADEGPVLYSYKTAVSTYHLLRILDDLLDVEIDRLRKRVATYQHYLRHSYKDHDVASDRQTLREMNDFVIQVTNLAFEISELMEEIDNPDKLIDDEWHIVLLDKLNDTFGVKAWRDSINARIYNLRQLVETVESTYQRLINLDINQTLLDLSIENKRAEETEKRVGYLFGVFAIAELLGLLINLGLNNEDPLVRLLNREFGLSMVASHIISSIGVFVLIAVLLWGIVYFVNRDVDNQ